MLPSSVHSHISAFSFPIQHFLRTSLAYLQQTLNTAIYTGRFGGINRSSFIRCQIECVVFAILPFIDAKACGHRSVPETSNIWCC